MFRSQILNKSNYVDTLKTQNSLKKLSQHKIKCYEKARRLIYDGGLKTEAERLNKLHIEPQKSFLNKSKTQKIYKSTSPQFNVRYNKYNDQKLKDAMKEKRVKEQQELDE